MSDHRKEGIPVAALLPERKPTLHTLRRTYDIPSRTLADAAGVSLTDLYVMEIGGPVQETVAVNVLKAFSELTGKTFRFDDISVRVKKG